MTEEAKKKKDKLESFEPIIKVGFAENRVYAPLDDPTYMEYRSILHYPPNYILFKNFPSELPDNFVGAKYSFFGAVKTRVDIQARNGVTIPKHFHKLFIVNLIDPPIYEDIAKSQLGENFGGESQTLLSSKQQREHFFRWNQLKYNDENYREIEAFCRQNEILLIDEFSIHLVASKLERVAETEDY